MRAYRAIFLAGALIAVFGLSACDLSTPSQVLTGKIRVKEQMITKTLDAGRVDRARVSAIMDDFARNGKGAMSLTVSYLSGDQALEAAADKQGDAYKKAFQKLGAPTVSVVTVPVADAKYAGKVIVAYRGLAALAPKGCTRIPGYQGSEPLEAMDQYQVGCDTNAALSQMIADPSDLMGRAGVAENDSRRSGIVVDAYKSGTPNQPMKGYSASKIGN